FERMRAGVGGDGGWGGLLEMFSRTANVYHPEVKPAAFIFAVNDGVADRAFQGLKPEELWMRTNPNTNAMLWIYAHMAVVRSRLLKALGGEYDTGWGEAFARGAQLQDSSVYPDREKIQQVSREVNARLFARLRELTDADLAQPAKGPVPPAVQTV